MFGQEREMTVYASNWLKSHNLHFKCEFNTSWGICDLIGVSFNEKNVNKRIGRNQTKPIGSILRASIINQLPDIDDGHSKTKRKLYKAYQTFYSDDRLDKEISWLEKERYIVEPIKNHFQKVNGWMPLHNKIIMIELKLNRIKEVFHQAYNNLAIATDSYAAFPMDVAMNLVKNPKSQKFGDAGIGILGIDRNRCEVVLETRPNDSADKTLQFYYLDRFWKQVITDN